jgi:hypothetical protein
MSLGTKSIRHRRPNHVMSADGEPEAVLIDFPTWKMILAYLEDVVDNQNPASGHCRFEDIGRGQSSLWLAELGNLRNRVRCFGASR